MNLHLFINLVIILTIIIGGVIAWNMAKGLDDSSNKNSGNRVTMKIDYKGRYHYDFLPDSGNTNLLFWVRLCIVIVALILAALPFQSILQRS